MKPAAPLRADLDALERTSALFEEAGFASRADALERLEHLVDRVEALLAEGGPQGELLPLRERAAGAMRRLEEVDGRLFRRLRPEIRAGAPLRALIDRYAPPVSRLRDEPGYDGLDAFVDGLLLGGTIPEATRPLEPEMVPYQRTPARVVLEMVERARLTEEDVFCDLGSGLGQVCILASLLGESAALGIEVEPAYRDYARARAAELGLSRVEFVGADAREADLSRGSVFFMFTPFGGTLLGTVLERLRAEARTRRIRLFTYGPCTPRVAREGWLERVGDGGEHPYRLTELRSRETGRGAVDSASPRSSHG